MTIITCSGDGCDQELYANNPDTQGYCPACSHSHATHTPGYGAVQYESQRADEHRRRIVDNTVTQE